VDVLYAGQQDAGVGGDHPARLEGERTPVTPAITRAIMAA
jgi:hypothetical protein